MIKKILYISCALSVLSSTVFCQVRLDSSIINSKVLVAAHRGDWRNAPENSLKAFDNATKLGVDIIELDLALTKDSVVIVMHDQSIDRTTNGTGSPSQYSLQEIKKFYLKSGHGQLTMHKIPTLEEALQLLKGRVWINLDKSYPYFREAYKVLVATGTLNQCIFKSSENYKTVKNKYGDLLDKIIYMPVVRGSNPDALKDILEYNTRLKPYAFELVAFDSNSDILNRTNEITSSGSKIWINALWPSLNDGHDDDRAVEMNQPDQSWGWLIAHGATIIQTDRPKELIQYLREKGLHR
ncbi:glycerophosphodiester phosphodiesterase family protein [Pedobacter sandarakinus]|uniref:glycerophosphodiester phosphodiesterase family protein n=1 Tax=Pedobacter sandarakinus TaxID=353156 RepID=UPI002247B9ED|nr:glycerophosphodiester phosphodiesterase family protein [Pedobacter sandarakinus]MCX2574588.1 glycerophosphodiester phosphodiesterase family protein [Pedobacter sandarakinus]